MNARVNKRRVMQRFHGRFYSPWVWESAEDRQWLNEAPVGREFGSPDYERLSILDMYAWGTITESEAMKRLGLDQAAFKAMMDKDGNPHANDLPAYEPDDGPLTAKDLAAIRKEAAKHLPKGKLLSRKDLFE